MSFLFLSLVVVCVGCDIEVQAAWGLLCLDGWISLRCPGLIGTYVRNLKILFDALLDDFYSQILANAEKPYDRRTKKQQAYNKASGFPYQQQRYPSKSLDTTASQRGGRSPDGVLAKSSTTAATIRSPDSLSVNLFSGSEGQSLKDQIAQLVKRLVEFEGHRL